MQCNAKSAKPICYSSVHNVRSLVQCNAMPCNAGQSNANQYNAIQCNAKTLVMSLINMGMR